jgi:hypothetical protein
MCPRFLFVDTNFRVHTPIILIHIVGVQTVRTGRLRASSDGGGHRRKHIVEGSGFGREGLLGAVEESLSGGSQRVVGSEFQVRLDIADDRGRILLALVNCGEKEVAVGQGGV